MTYAVRVIADSVSPYGARITTIEATFPRFILAELNTHRMLSKNSASSRAIPTTRIIQAVKLHPFVPLEWGSNRSGMSAGPEISDPKKALALWMEARDKAVFVAEALARAGVHKQIANRVLEPFMWHTAIITATTWDNFLNLRTQDDAQPEFRRLALMIRDVLDLSIPTPKEPLQWHLPYVSDEEYETLATMTAASVSAARCARVSYLTHDRRDTTKDLELSDRLQQNGHMSPFEHPAMCLHVPARWGNFIGWKQYRKMIPNEHDPKGENRGTSTE